jgi:hypothetical protein
MLRITDILDSLALARIAGDRRHGHFDHDAHRSVGPSEETFSQTGRQGSGESNAPSQPLKPFRAVKDPETGEALYYPEPDSD